MARVHTGRPDKDLVGRLERSLPPVASTGEEGRGAGGTGARRGDEQHADRLGGSRKVIQMILASCTPSSCHPVSRTSRRVGPGVSHLLDLVTSWSDGAIGVCRAQ